MQKRNKRKGNKEDNDDDKEDGNNLVVVTSTVTSNYIDLQSTIFDSSNREEGACSGDWFPPLPRPAWWP